MAIYLGAMIWNTISKGPSLLILGRALNVNVGMMRIAG